MGLASAVTSAKARLSSYQQIQKAGGGQGAISAQDGNVANEEGTQETRPRPKTQYKAQPSKKDWANMEFDGWEKNAQAWLSDTVANDLNPPEIHFGGGRPPTDEEQVAAYQQRQKPTALTSYGNMAEAFRLSGEKALFGPLLAAGSVFQDPMKAVRYLEMLGAASQHPVVMAKAVGTAVVRDAAHTLDVIAHGNGEARAALAGGLIGGAVLGGYFKFGLGIAGAGIINPTRKAVNIFDATNHINGLRLQRQLRYQQAEALFDNEGYLTPEIIDKAKRIIDGKDLKNSKLVEVLRAKGKLEDWGKYATNPIIGPLGPLEIHFYHNPLTKEVFYDMDYKIIFNRGGDWKPGMQPSFVYEPRI